uniref:CSON007711 protein n=1 Tax=Culicoides sonorensis TaxID=179676 RepID=A0A336LXT6_CULSO
MITITQSLKDLLLKEHNKWRQMLAMGSVDGYPAATRMLKVHWDDELEFLAYKHANHCVFEHDKCRVTEKYPKSGQNLGLKLYSREFNDIIQIIEELCAEWFEEYNFVPKHERKDIVTQYKHNAKWGHFTVMARERNDAIGCALVSMKNTKLNPRAPFHYMLTCNYPETNLPGPLYDHGDACSRCDSYGPTFKCDKADYFLLCDLKLDTSTSLPETSSRTTSSARIFEYTTAPNVAKKTTKTTEKHKSCASYLESKKN